MTRFVAVCCAVLLLAGACAGGGSPDAPPRDVLVSNTCEGKAWLAAPPAEDGEYLYFVGQSARHGLERDSRNDAERDAINKFVQFTGVDVTIVDEYLQTSFNLSSEITDPTVAERRKQEMRAQAFVRRAKAREWCTERYQRLQGDQVTGSVFITSVLMRVPRDEYDAVQAYNREQQVKLNASRDRVLREAQAFYQAALNDERQGRLVGAFEQLRLAEAKLEQAAAMRADASPPPDTLSRPTLNAAEVRMTAGLALQRTPERAQVVEPGQTPQNLRVTAVYHGAAGTVPVAGLPLLFIADGKILAQMNTDAQGQAQLQMRPMQRMGQVAFRVQVNRGLLRDKVSEDVQVALANLQAEFVVEVREYSLDEKAQDLVNALAQAVPAPMSVVVENFTYGDSQTSGLFVSRFRAMLESALVNSQRFSMKRPVSRTGLTRGFTQVSANAPAAMAHASGSEAVLFGQYYEENDQVVVRAQLADRDNRTIASGAIRIDRGRIPADWSLRPTNYAQHLSAAQQLGPPTTGTGDFRLDLWIDKGAGGTYEAGDTLTVSVRAAEACYLKLIYLDASNNHIVIYPNAFQRDTRIAADRTVIIPAAGAGFDFTIQPPFGAETLVAFASTTAFPPDQGRDIGNGMILLDQSLGEIARRNRGFVGTGKRAEARVTLTTIPRQR